MERRLDDESDGPAQSGTNVPKLLRTPAGSLALAVGALSSCIAVGELGGRVSSSTGEIVLATELAIVGALFGLGWIAPGPEGARSAGRALLWTGLAAGLALLGLHLLHGSSPGLQADADAVPSVGGGWSLLLLVTVGAPIGEELLYRRVVHSGVQLGCGRIAAFVVSALVFAVAHPAIHHAMFVLALNVISWQAASYVWLALCCSLAYDRAGTVWAPIAVHALWNGVAVLG